MEDVERIAMTPGRIKTLGNDVLGGASLEVKKR